MQVLPRVAHSQGYSTFATDGVLAGPTVGACATVGATLGACVVWADPATGVGEGVVVALDLGTYGAAFADRVDVCKWLFIVEVNVGMFAHDNNVIFVIIFVVS